MCRMIGSHVSCQHKPSDFSDELIGSLGPIG